MTDTRKIIALIFIIVSLIMGIFIIALNGYYIIEDIIVWDEIWGTGVINVSLATIAVVFNILTMIFLILLMRKPKSEV